ncbi:MAG: FAD-dependent oxidoreductase [Vicinamibacterales bacterium]
MAFANSSLVETGASLDADICIVGAGPVGLAVAIELADAGRRVVLLESGGLSRKTGSAAEADGAQGFGGTRWYGRLVKPGAIDFEERPWVPLSGWPVSRLEVESRYARAAQFLGVTHSDALEPEFWQDDSVYQALSGGGVVAVPHLFTASKDLGRRYQRLAASSSRLTVLLDATVVGIDVDSTSGTVTGLRVRSPGGRRFASRASRYVLACGGSENARLLLILIAERPGVLGRSSDVVGRYYMNHVRTDGAARLRLDPTHPNYVQLYRRLTEGPSVRSRCRTQVAFTLDERVQRSEGLLNACAFFYPSSTPRVAELSAHVRRLQRDATSRSLGQPAVESVARLARELPLLAQVGLARLRRRPFAVESLVMVEQLEQVPDAESRLVLGGERDQFDRPRLRVPFRVDEATRRTERRFHQLIAERIDHARIGRLKSQLGDPNSQPIYGDASHPMGTTRMSIDPRLGVVDPHGRVHGLENLYVAGSSILPTGGQANPTLTIVALAMRLADSLRDQ